MARKKKPRPITTDHPTHRLIRMGSDPDFMTSLQSVIEASENVQMANQALQYHEIKAREAKEALQYAIASFTQLCDSKGIKPFHPGCISNPTPEIEY